MSFGVNPVAFSVGAGAMTRSNGSTSHSRLRAWVGVRPFSMRASTGTPAFSASSSTASSHGMAPATSSVAGASSARLRGTTSRYAGTSVAFSARAMRIAAERTVGSSAPPVNGDEQAAFRALRPASAASHVGSRPRRPGRRDDGQHDADGSHGASAPAVGAVGDDADVDPGKLANHAREQGAAQDLHSPTLVGSADEDVGRAALLGDAADRSDEIVALLLEEVDAEHACEPSQRGQLDRFLAGRRPPGGRTQTASMSEPSRCAERQARRRMRCDLGCGSISARTRSATACLAERLQHVRAAAAPRRPRRPRAGRARAAS